MHRSCVLGALWCVNAFAFLGVAQAQVAFPLDQWGYKVDGGPLKVGNQALDFGEINGSSGFSSSGHHLGQDSVVSRTPTGTKVFSPVNGVVRLSMLVNGYGNWIGPCGSGGRYGQGYVLVVESTVPDGQAITVLLGHLQGGVYNENAQAGIASVGMNVRVGQYVAQVADYYTCAGENWHHLHTGVRIGAYTPGHDSDYVAGYDSNNSATLAKWREPQAFLANQAINAAYNRNGGVANFGSLTSDLHWYNNNINLVLAKDYQGGVFGRSIIVDDANGRAHDARVVRGGFATNWFAQGGPASLFGVPITNEFTLRSGSARQMGNGAYYGWVNGGFVQYAYNGGVSPGQGSWNATQDFIDCYNRMIWNGSDRRSPGVPYANGASSAAVHDWNGYQVQDFQGGDYYGTGAMIRNSSDGRVRLVHSVYWNAFRAANGIVTLGAPTSDQSDKTGTQFFQRGRIVGHETWAEVIYGARAGVVANGGLSALGDVDGDGFADLVSLDSTAGAIHVALSLEGSFEGARDDAQFLVVQAVQPGAESRYAVCVRDVNLDQLADVVVVDHVSGKTLVFESFGEYLDDGHEAVHVGEIQ